ncbi:MAG: hypothetical protein Q7S87_09580 [Agitococcus sp.]|nr:hypothetical protein [Agitococcus sp.]
MNEALTSVLATNSPDGIFNVLGEVARTAIGLCADALNLPSAPVDQFSFATVFPSAPMATSGPTPSEVALCMALDELLASWNTRAPDSPSLAIRRINARAQVERLFALPAYKSAEALRLSHEAQALEIHRLTQRLALLEATISLSDESNDAPFTPDWAGYRQGLADGKAEAIEEAMANLNKNRGLPPSMDGGAGLNVQNESGHVEEAAAITPQNSAAEATPLLFKLISTMTHDGQAVRLLFNCSEEASTFRYFLNVLGVQEVASTGLPNAARVGVIAHDLDSSSHYVAGSNGTPELGTELFCAGVESREEPSRQNIRVDFLKCFANLESAAARTYYFEPIAQLLRLIDQQPACPAPKENNAPYMLALVVNKDAQPAFATNSPSIRDAFEIAERASDLTRCTDDEYANPCVQASWVTWQIRQTEITKLEQRVAALDSEAANLRTTMIAAAEEIHKHWGAHCDVEGYGPTNLMHRLERGISTGYPGYNVGQFTKLERLNAELTDELARKQSEMTVAQRQVATVFRTDSGEAFPLMLNDTLHQRWLNAGKSGYPVYASLDEFCDQSIGLLSVTHHPESVGTRITAESRAWDLPAGHYFLNAALSPARPVVAVGSLTVTVTNGVASVGIDIHPQATELADGQYPLYTTAVLLSANEPEIATRESPVKHLLLASGTFLLWQKPVAETSAALAPSKGVEI